ncbi:MULTISPECIES: hypothetical protein [Streptomyces]|uniref:Uncharacterized protein n=2 Tax=Streptomyces TaxID=1883 RepID=A0A652KTJ5_9ACTN|nr:MULTISPECIES: hypothetical protein [unclassified Streptomyces]WSS63736.1 hypothetical protein OG284_22140 [Streptomyces sp. NBC_01177]WSS70732.1 hypothetical protein OG491_21770 [Streptomyces sp. NBC_01175]WSS77749.1 hypothetical protein OG414_22130 [Streptomyces sp. NBC_01174]MDX3323176.1 hypothetical protein [Streptomyces sp. ME02-6979-3A]MDX3431494.1 hypothetical protein [Streptomyces sp. ME01-18a]
MSQPVQPPNPPQQPYGGQPTDGNPYAGQQQPGTPYPGQPAGAPTGNPFAGQQPGQFGGGMPFAPAAPARNNIGLGVLTALGTAIVAAILYGVIAGSIEREVGYAAVGVGFLVGFAASKVGGANPLVAVVSAAFSLGAVFLGQLVGMSMILADGLGVGFSEVFFDHFGDLLNVWKHEADFMTYLFLALGPIAAFGGAKRAG